MTEEATATAAEEVTTETTTEQTTPARDYEAEARAQGWVPEAEFKGEKKPAQFLDAETFVKRGEEITPFIRKENQRLKEEAAKRDAEFAKRIERLEKTNRITFEAQQKAHEAEIARVKREMRAAVSSGDEAEFDRLEKVRDGLEKSAPKPDEPDEKLTPEAELSRKQEAWRAANPWFDDDFEMQEFAIKYSDFHGRKHPNMSFEDNMKVVEAEVRKKFPDKFKSSAANGHAAVDGGGSFSAAPVKKGLAAKLPAEARAQAAKDVANKLYKDEEAWAKVYFGN